MIDTRTIPFKVVDLFLFSKIFVHQRHLVSCMSSLPQRAGRGKAQGEVMPTLDMTLFDWTDYEDMKPVDTWPSSKKKGEGPAESYSSDPVNTDAGVLRN